MKKQDLVDKIAEARLNNNHFDALQDQFNLLLEYVLEQPKHEEVRKPSRSKKAE
jgi:hypothetical protein